MKTKKRKEGVCCGKSNCGWSVTFGRRIADTALLVLYIQKDIFEVMQLK